MGSAYAPQVDDDEDAVDGVQKVAAQRRRSCVGRAPFFYGYVVLAAAVFSSCATYLGTTMGIGIVMGDIVEDLANQGVPNARTFIASAVGMGQHSAADVEQYSIGSFLGSPLTAVTGFAMDRFGVRPVTALMVAILGAAVSLLSVSNHVAAFGACFTVIRFAGIGGTVLGGTTAISRFLECWLRGQL